MFRHVDGHHHRAGADSAGLRAISRRGQLQLHLPVFARGIPRNRPRGRDDGLPSVLAGSGTEIAAGARRRLSGVDLFDQAGGFCRGRRAVRRRHDFAVAADFNSRTGEGVIAGGSMRVRSARRILFRVPVGNEFNGSGACDLRSVAAPAAFKRPPTSHLSAQHGPGCALVSHRQGAD